MSEDIFTNDSDELEGLINPRLSSEEIVSNLDDHASQSPDYDYNPSRSETEHIGIHVLF